MAINASALALRPSVSVSATTLALLLVGALVVAFVGYPLFSAAREVRIFEVAQLLTPDRVQPFTNSLLLAALTALPCVLIGVPLAWLCARTDLPGRGLLVAAVSLSFVIPVLVTSIAYIFLFGRNGGLVNRALAPLLGSPLYDVYSFSGVVLVTALHSFPLVFFTTYAGLLRMNPELEEAGRICGLGPVQVFRRITAGAIAPSIFAGVIFVVAEALTVLASPLLLGSPVRISFMTTELFSTIAMNPNLPAAVALSLPLIGVTLLLIWLQYLSTGGGSSAKFAVVSGKGARAGSVQLGKWRPLTLFLAWVPIFFSLILPTLTIGAASLMQRWWKGFSPDNFTFENFAFLAGEASTLSAVKNSLILSFGVAAFMAAFGAVLAILLAGDDSLLKRTIRSLVAVPLGLPHVVAAVFILLAWYGEPFDLGGSLWILALGYVFVMAPYALRTCEAARGQIDTSLAEAGQVSGMSPLSVWWHIMMPLMKTGIVTTFVIVFLFTIKEFSLTALVYSADTKTLPVRIYSFLEGGSYERTAASSILLLLLTAGGLLVASRVLRISVSSLKV